MAYRGDTTDPLENMINRNRATKRIVLVLVAMWVLPSLLRTDLSVLTSVFDNVRPQPSTPIAAPSANPVPRVPAVSTPKMNAGALENLLRSAPTSNRAPRDVRCTPGQNGWDFICTYQVGVPRPHTRLKIGVRVSANEILQASAPHPFASPLPNP